MSLRNLIDAALTKTLPLPIAGAGANTLWLEVDSGPHIERMEIRIGIDEAVPNLPNGEVITLTLHQSNDGINDGGAIPELEPLVITGAGGIGAAVAFKEFRLPSDVGPFIALFATVQAGGGNNTGTTFSLTPLF